MKSTSSSLSGITTADDEMHDQLILTSLTVFGVLTMLLFSLILCGKGRAIPQKGPPRKNVKPHHDETKALKKSSKINEKPPSQKKPKTEVSKGEQSQINATSEVSKDQKKNSPKKACIESDGLEFTQQQSNTEDLQLSSTQVNTHESHRDVKGGAVDNKGRTPVKGYLVSMDATSHRSARKDGNQQRNFVKEMNVAETQNSTKQTQSSTKEIKQTQSSLKDTKQTQSSLKATQEDSPQKQPSHRQHQRRNEHNLSSTQPPVPSRDINRDKELAMKALMNIRAKRAQNAYSARERRQALEAMVAKQTAEKSKYPEQPQPEQPQPCETKEKAPILSNDDENNDHRTHAKAQKKSSSFSNIDVPEIIPGEEKIAGAIEIEKENEENDDEEESEKPKKKMILCQAPTYVPPEKREFRPLSELPEDDLTIKREVKKKKKKKKHKKKVKKSSDDDKNEASSNDKK